VRVRRPEPGPAAHPVLIMLHGLGANESDIYELVPFVDRRVLIVAPRGPGQVDNSPRGSWKWYDRVEVGEPLPGLRDTSLERLNRLFDQLEELGGVPVDPTQIYMGGFSQGAITTLLTAATFPERLAGIIAHSGAISRDAAERLGSGIFRGKGAFVAHGVADDILSVNLGRKVRATLEAGGVDLTYREYPIDHSTSVESRRDLAEWLNQRLRMKTQC
jgi:phospholipase/carboxylesterase